jgi:hypothetical protein
MGIKQGSVVTMAPKDARCHGTMNRRRSGTFQPRGAYQLSTPKAPRTPTTIPVGRSLRDWLSCNMRGSETRSRDAPPESRRVQEPRAGPEVCSFLWNPREDHDLWSADGHALSHRLLISLSIIVVTGRARGNLCRSQRGRLVKRWRA